MNFQRGKAREGGERRTVSSRGSGCDDDGEEEEDWNLLYLFK